MARKKARRAHGEGSVYQRKSDKRYVAKVPLEDGTFKEYYFKKQEDAVHKLQQAQYEKQHGMLVTGPQQSVRHYLDHWLENIQRFRVKETTYIRYRQLLDLHLIPAFGHLRLHKLTPEHLDAYYAKKMKAGLQARTLHLHHAILHKALKDAVRRKLITQNPCDAIDRPKALSYQAHPLTPEQAQRLLEAARGNRLEGMLTLAIITGMRYGELASLRWQDIDFERHILYVNRTVSRYSGYGFLISEPKSARSKRQINLSHLLVQVLKQHRAHQVERRLQLGSAWVDKDLVFCARNGNFLHPRSVILTFRRILERAGLPQMRFHDLRHSAATILLSMGIHPKVVQDLLGHSSITQTMDTYSHVISSVQIEAIEKMSLLFRQSQ